MYYKRRFMTMHGNAVASVGNVEIVEIMEVGTAKDHWGVDAVMVTFRDIFTDEYTAMSKLSFFERYEKVPEEDVELAILGAIV